MGQIFDSVSNCQSLHTAIYKCQILVAGDFNIHVERAGDADAARLHDILQSFDCVQQVPLTPTHRNGETFDLVVTKSEQIRHAEEMSA